LLNADLGIPFSLKMIGSYEWVYEQRGRLIESRVAQIGTVLLAIGFAVQIWGNLIEN
jgi:hypothetical protein